MQSPEQVSDFDAGKWFVRNRRPKSGQPPVARARGPRADSRSLDSKIFWKSIHTQFPAYGSARIRGSPGPANMRAFA